MILELRENVPHGTKEYPYDQYFIRRVSHPFQIPVHWHDELEIIYVKQGTLHVCIEGQDYTGYAGSVFFVNPRELHFMGSKDLSTAYYTLLFPLEFISFQTMDDLESALFMPLRSGRLQLAHEIPESSVLPEFHALLEQAIGLDHKKPSLSCQIKIRTLLLNLLSLLAEQNHLLAPAVSGSQTDIQRELLAYIQKHYTEKLTLEDLAMQFHLTEKYLSRYFKEHFRLTFSDYTNYLRLTNARRLLETTELPITEVALQSGFFNVSYFIRTFKLKYGSSPLKYRKAAGAGANAGAAYESADS